jgi:hypothetical protein
MNRLVLAFLTLVFGFVLAGKAPAEETKTDPRRDVFVENSTTNFVLGAKPGPSSSRGRVAFDLSAPQSGDHTLVCFIDGKLLKTSRFVSPGIFELSTRGMAPGSYRVTLQLVDPQGRVGRHTQRIRVK